MADKEYAPWSRETEDGLITSAVDSHVRIDQNVVPALNVGSIDKDTGIWSGVQSSDILFRGFTTHTIPNGASELFPVDETFSKIDMTGFSDIFIAIKNSSGSTFAIQAVMGLGTNTFGGLTPLNAASSLKGTDGNIGSLSQLFNDTSEALQDNTWNILSIQGVLAGQKNLQFKITNGSGGESIIEFAYLRVV